MEYESVSVGFSAENTLYGQIWICVLKKEKQRTKTIWMMYWSVFSVFKVELGWLHDYYLNNAR